MSYGYVLYIDILGFSKMVKSLDQNNLHERLKEWLEIINELKKEFDLQKIVTFSDTLVVLESHEKEKLIKLVQFSKRLLETCFKKSFPIRGAICLGEYFTGDGFGVSGNGYVRAHNICEKQNWVGVCLDETVNRIIARLDYKKHSLVVYPIPLKNEKNEMVKLATVINWDVPSYEEIKKYLFSKGIGGISGKCETINMDLYYKINNILQFRIYLKCLAASGKTPDKFMGTHALEVIDMNIKVFLNLSKES